MLAKFSIPDKKKDVLSLNYSISGYRNYEDRSEDGKVTGREELDYLFIISIHTALS